MQRAAIYARVSSEKQEQERTIESQLAALHEACKRAGVEVVGTYADDGISGTTLARPALDKLRDDAARGVFECLYILSPDRLARRYLYQAIVLDEFRKRGVQVMFLDKAVTDRPDDQLLLGMQGLIAEYERAQIIERTRRGKLFRARAGEVQTAFPLYGYRLVRRTGTTLAHYLVDDEQAAVVRLIYALYVKYRSCLRVVEDLHRRGIRSPRGLEWWCSGNIVRLLRCEAYVGTLHYNKNKEKGRRRPRSEWIPIKVPAIVDQDIFGLAQRLLTQNAGSRPRLFYLLSRIVRCASCGHLYIGNSGGQQRAKRCFYQCAYSRKSYPRERGCDARWVRAEDIESSVLETLRHALASPAYLTTLVAGTAGDNPRGQEEELAGRRRMLQAKEQRLLDLYVEGGLSKEDFASRREALATAIAEVDRQLSTTTATGSWTPADVQKQVAAYCQRAAALLEASDSTELQHFLRLLIDVIVYDASRNVAEIRAHIPSPALGWAREPDAASPETLANSARSMKFVVTAEVPRRRSDRLRAVHA